MRTNRLLVLAVLLPLAGCGEGGGVVTSTPSPAIAASSTPAPSAKPSVRPDLTGLSAAQLTARARTALRTAKTLRVYGVIIDADGTLAMDVSFGRTGTTANMVVKGHRIEFVLIGTVGYLKASDSYWRATDGKVVAALMSGRWLRGKLTDEGFRDFADLSSVAVFIDAISDSDRSERPAKIGMKTVNGVACIGLATADSTLWIDKYTAQPVQLGPGQGSKDKSRLNFSQFNAAREPVAPPPSLVIDASKLV